MAGGGLSLSHRTSLCYLLFSTFIIMDVYVSLTTVFLLTRSDTWVRTNITDGDVTRTQGGTNQSLPVKEMTNHSEKSFSLRRKPSDIGQRKGEFEVPFIDPEQEGWEEPPTYFKKVSKQENLSILLLDVFAEFSGFTVFLILNVTALVGLRKSKALLLLPWIIVYLISISASYINFSFLLITNLVSDSVNNWRIFLPLATGIIFQMGWILVKSVFEDFKKQMQRSEQERSQVGLVTTTNL